MRTIRSLITCLGIIFYSGQVFSQCQTIVPVIESINPSVPMGDSLLYLCIGDTLQIEASGFYPENELFYTQADSLSVFTWTVNTNELFTGQQLTYVANEPGVMQVYLQITDTVGCTMDIPWNQMAVVYGPPSQELISIPAAPYCEGQVVDLIPDTTASNYYPDYFTYDNNPFPLPDGTGLSYFTNIFITEFADTDTISSTSEMAICASLEHSYMRDLEIILICPNGQQTILHEFAGQTGGEVLLGIPEEMDEIGQPIPGIPFKYCWEDDPTLPTWIEYANANNPPTLPAGTYRSFESYSTLQGCPVNGVWTFQVTDLWGVDNGFIFDWSIQFDTILLGTIDLPLGPFQNPTASASWVPNPAILSIQNDTATVMVENGINLQIDYTNDFGCSFTVDYPFEGVISDTLIACADCDSLLVEAGPNDTLSCPMPQALVAGSSNLESNFALYTWTDEQGNILAEADSFFVHQAGTYFFTVTNVATGCSQVDSLEIISDILLPIADAGNDTLVQCPDSPIILDGTNSSQGPAYSYLWSSNQPIDLPTSLQPEVSNTGNYILAVTDNNTGCVALDTVMLTVSTELVLAFSSQNASCDLADGSTTIELLPGTPAASYLWSNGQTTATATGLSQGWYNVTVTTDNCATEQAVYIDEDTSCKVTIQGTIFDDSNDQSCLETGNVSPVECMMVHLLPDDIYTYSDANGQYEFVVDAGSYTIEYIEEDAFNLLCPAAGTITVDLPMDGSVSANNHFFIVKDEVQNLCLSIADGPVRPGFEYQLNYFISNVGDFPALPVFTLSHPEVIEPGNLLDFTTFYDPVLNNASIDYPELLPDNTIYQTVFMQVTLEAEPDSTVNFSLQVLPINGDSFPENNTLDYSRVVTASFDPNDKTTFTGENQYGGAIYLPQDSILHYQVRFQNTGTDTAFNVVIRDTLSPHLNVESIRPGFASHDMEVAFEGNNVLIFRFPDILLPDSTTNEPLSHGFVTYSINLKPGLALGTEIRNDAAIYFDFNDPIITNETVHVISEPTGTKEPVDLIEFGFSPNPTTGAFHLDFTLPTSSFWKLSLVNTQGQIVEELRPWQESPSGKTSFAGTLQSWPDGAYFLFLETDQQQSLIPIIIQQ